MDDLKWIRSSYSGGNGGSACVEVAALATQRAVRDSKNPDGPTHLFEDSSWSAFVASASSTGNPT